MLDIKVIVNGFLEENCYIVNDGTNALIIDPGSESDKIIELINKNNLVVKGILITHYHFDHVGALNEIKDKYDVPVIDFKCDGDMEISNFKFKIIKTYGHTLDSVSYYFYEDNTLFSGDFIFKETIGNYVLENEKYMIESLKKFKKLDDNIIVYPGHGELTSVLNEKETNPFLRGL